MTVPLVRDIIVADILPSFAGEENKTHADEGSKARTAAMETEHVHLAGYRIMVQTIRSMMSPFSLASSVLIPCFIIV